MSSPDVRCLQPRHSVPLLISLFMVATCALTYELLIGTVSSYFLGSSVLHFSLTIGIFMFFLGVGAFCSKFIHSDELSYFILAESILGVIGGSSVFLLQYSFALTPYFYLVALLLTGSIATLCGLEVPLLSRILLVQDGVKQTLAHALSFDYFGGLIASIVFPLVLLPYLGTQKTACAVGLINITVATTMCWLFWGMISRRYTLLGIAAIGMMTLSGLLYWSESLSSVLEQSLYDDEIVHAEQSHYQRIVVTKFQEDVRLYLNGDLQFSATDEYRYHEPLVHIPLAAASQHGRILVLGGGDGMVVRELVKYHDVASITLVDLDPAVVQLAKRHPLFRSINHDALSDSRVTVIHEDAWVYLQHSSDTFNVIIADLPDANDYALGKLYSQEFYIALKRHLAAEGIFVTQAASPYFTPDAFWCIAHTVGEVFGTFLPYQSSIPSFGPWGFVLAGTVRGIPTLLPDEIEPLRYLTPALIPSLFIFDREVQERPTPINRLDNQELVHLYAAGWQRYQ
jgi:spermidine synthase